MNLTEKQKEFVRWAVARVKEGKLDEEFAVLWTNKGGLLHGMNGKGGPDITPGLLDALAAEGLILSSPRYQTSTSTSGRQLKQREYETSRRCTLTGKAYKAAESDFAAPDQSFVTHLTPLADVTSLDAALKERCLPILGAGAVEPKLWDSAVRTAGVILEERLRSVGGLKDPSCTGRALVNRVFGSKGALSNVFATDSERQGYRDLYAGAVGVIRNPYAHRLLDPTPEDGGAFIVFVNLLLKMLEDLRPDN